MPGTASSAESVLGQAVAMLRNVRSPKIRKAGMFLRFASVRRQARNACSRRACRSDGRAAEAVFAGLDRGCAAASAVFRGTARLLLRLAGAVGTAASFIKKTAACFS